jgi:hypothetical protein
LKIILIELNEGRNIPGCYSMLAYIISTAAVSVKGQELS